MKRLLYITIYLILLCNYAIAQNYYSVTHSSGKKVIAGTEVEVINIDAARIYPLPDYCGAGPYFIGTSTIFIPGGSSGYKYKFSKSPRQIRFQTTGSDSGERFIIKLNDTFHALKATEVSGYTNTCGGSNSKFKVSAGIVVIDSGATNNNVQITIKSNDIQSVTITDELISAGSTMSFMFVFDTTINIVNYVDTLLCVGDTMHIPYEVTGTFLPGNIFTFQISDKDGSFANPSVLGTVAGTENGVFKCVVPGSLLSSGDYRIRIVSSLPYFISAPFENKIGIGHPPSFVTFTSAPVCENDTVVLGTTNFSHVSDYSWSGPSVKTGFPAHYVRIPDAKMKDAGMYYVKVFDYGCAAFDSIQVDVRPNPLHSIGNVNTPLCTGDTLKLISNIDTAGAKNVWLSANGNSYNMARVLLPNVQLTDTGQYILTTTLNGCTERDTAYVVVNPTPIPHASTTAVCTGDMLVLESALVPFGVYEWTGPNGFMSGIQNNVIYGAGLGASGKYTVSIALNGCVGKDSVNALVKPRPPVPKIKAIAALCEGDVLHFYVDDVVSSANYNWSGPNNYSAATAETNITNTSTAHTGEYVLTAEINGCVASDTVAVVVKHTPVAPILSYNHPLFEGDDLFLKILEKEQGVGYSWVGPSGFYSTDFEPVIRRAGLHNTGRYMLTASLDGCTSYTSLLVDFAKEPGSDLLVLYPNPNNGNFKLKAATRSKESVPVIITNATGQVVYYKFAEVRNKLIEADIQLKDVLSSGAYLLRITVDAEIRSIPFVVNRNP